MNKQEARELLPWFVAGTLSQEEHRTVQAFVESGEIEPQELNEYALFAEAVIEQSDSEPAYNPAILDNVMAQLDEAPQAPAVDMIVSEAAPSESWLAKLASRWQWSATPSFAKFAMAGQFALLLALAGVLVSQPGQVEDEGYGTVSGPVVNVTQGDVTVAFAPDTPVSQVQDLLIALSAEIVAGPDSLGMYTIALSPGSDATATLEVLRDQAIVEFAERVAK